jgi:5-methylcytosine-specific restriction protein A
VTRIEVNRYERDREARKACIRHHLTACTVCGFDFNKRYGAIGAGFVRVVAYERSPQSDRT